MISQSLYITVLNLIFSRIKLEHVTNYCSFFNYHNGFRIKKVQLISLILVNICKRYNKEFVKAPLHGHF